jgi:hypothetical protein
MINKKVLITVNKNSRHNPFPESKVVEGTLIAEDETHYQVRKKDGTIEFILKNKDTIISLVGFLGSLVDAIKSAFKKKQK